jgi:hypothetical protein
MAKVQGKKSATSVKKKVAAKPAASAKKSKKPASKKPAAKPKVALKKAAAPMASKKAAKKAAAKKPAPKKAAPKKTAPKKVASKKPAPKKAAPKKVAAKPAAPKPAPKAAAKPAPKPAAKPAKAEKAVDAKVKAAGKPVAKVAAPPAAARVDDKKRRRSRPRLTSNGPATAAWFSQGDRPRSSSFIPAPPRAEAPSLVAAPPASSDRLVGSHELTEFAVRTVPVRIDIEAGGGKIYLTINPNETTLKIGEGIEWDFRYLGGADVVIEEMIIEFAKPSPFSATIFRSRRPGAARPHRQLSGPAQASAPGKTIHYIVRAFNAFKTEMSVAKPGLVVT